VLDVKLPAWVILKKDVQGTYISRRGIVFQAETAASKKHYGALFNDGIREVKEEEIEKFEVYDPSKKP
jgi:predicted small secreted protein